MPLNASSATIATFFEICRQGGTRSAAHRRLGDPTTVTCRIGRSCSALSADLANCIQRAIEVSLHMDSALITGMAAVLGSLADAFASIATTWMTQRSQRIREHAQLELRRREVLYGDFIAEVSRLTGDAFGHSLEHPETFANVYGLFGRMNLVASAPVMKAAEDCCRYLVDLYSRNMTQEEILITLRESSAHPLTAFGAACRAELDRYVT